MTDSFFDAIAMPAFDTQIIAHAALDPNLRAQILALCTDAYEEDFSFELSLLSRAILQASSACWIRVAGCDIAVLAMLIPTPVCSAVSPILSA